MTVVSTTLGDMDEKVLEKRTGVLDNEVEYTTWVEYWYNSELVHRSAHVIIKETPAIAGEIYVGE